LIQGFESLGDRVQGYLRGGGGVGWVMCDYMMLAKLCSVIWLCLMQRYGVSIYRIQHGIKCVQVDDKDWILCW